MRMQPILATLLVAFVVGCDDEGDGGRGGRDSGAQTTPLDCPELLACADACTTDPCTNACLDAASRAAVTQVTALVDCVADHGCGEDEACIASSCGPELAACGVDATPDGGTPPPGDSFPNRITGTTRDHTPNFGTADLDSNATLTFVRDDAAGSAAGYPIQTVAFYRLESITYTATYLDTSYCTSTAEETESFTSADPSENNLVIQRSAESDGRHYYQFATTLSVPHPNGMTVVCPEPIGTSTGHFNAEHNVTSGTEDQYTDLTTFVGDAVVGGARNFSWDLRAAD